MNLFHPQHLYVEDVLFFRLNGVPHISAFLRTFNTSTHYLWGIPLRWGKGRMKTIIDANTGEIIDVEEKNDIMIRQLNEVGTHLEEYAEMESQLDYIKEQIDAWKIYHRENIKKVLEQNGEKKVKIGRYSFTIVPEGTQKRLDTEWLKADGQYDNHLKLIHIDSYLKISKGKA